MAGRLGPLGGLARRIASPQAVLPLRGGGGGPVPLMRPPTQPLAEEDELMWDDGSANPEPCLDKFDLVTKAPREYPYEDLRLEMGGERRTHYDNERGGRVTASEDRA